MKNGQWSVVWVALGAAWFLAGGCASELADSPGEPVSAVTGALVGGQTDVDTEAANAVVNVSGCTGTLVAPTLVLTADHCRGISWGFPGRAPGDPAYDGPLPADAWVFFEEDRRTPGRCVGSCTEPTIRIGNDRTTWTDSIDGQLIKGVAYQHPPGNGDVILLRLNQAVCNSSEPCAALATPDRLATPIAPLLDSPHVGDPETWWKSQELRGSGWGLYLPPGELPVTGSETSTPTRQTADLRVVYFRNSFEDLIIDSGWTLGSNGPSPDGRYGDGDGLCQIGDSGSPFLWRPSPGEPEKVAGVYSSGFLCGGTKLFHRGGGGLLEEVDYSAWISDGLAFEAARLTALGYGASGLTTTARYVDRDGDGVPDPVDLCPDTFGPDNLPSSDGEPWGEACNWCPGLVTTTNIDTDGDEVGDACDNCPGWNQKNPDQANCNAVAEQELGLPVRGDVCDPHACGETAPQIRSGGIGTTSAIGRTVERLQVAPLRRTQDYGVDRTGFRFCPCSAAEDAFDDPEQQYSCTRDFALLDGTGACLIEEATDVYDEPESPGVSPGIWREITIDYSALAARFVAESSTSSVSVAGRRSEILHYKYSPPNIARAVKPPDDDDRQSRGLFEVGWSAADDVARWGVPAAVGLLWTHAYQTSGDGTTDADIREGQTHIVDGPFHTLAGPEPQAIPLGDCFHFFPGPPPPNPFGGPRFPRLPFAVPIDCISLLTTGPAVWFDHDRLVHDVALFDAVVNPIPPWWAWGDRFANPTPWELARLVDSGLGSTPVPHAAAVAFAPDLTSVRGVLQLRNGRHEPRPFTPSGAMPPPRTGFATAMSGRDALAWVGGGSHAGSPRTDLWRLDLDTGTWTEERLSVGAQVERILAIADSAPTHELLVLYEADVDGTSEAVLVRLRRGRSTPDLLGRWPLTHPARTFAMAVGFDGDVFLGSGDASGHHVARLHHMAADPVEEVGLAEGTERLAFDYFAADALGVSTVRRSGSQGGAMNYHGIGLADFAPGAAGAVF